MATTNNVTYPNIPCHIQGGQWRLIWSLTRAMKKAGWKYKASGASTAGTIVTNDLTLPTGTVYVIDSSTLPPAPGTVYIATSAGEQAVSFTAKSAAQLTGCTGGTGRIYNGSPVSATSNKNNNADPALDKWGPGTATGVSGSSAVVATPSRGRSSVTGLAGITAADKGRFLLISGSTPANNHQHQIEEIVSASSVKIDARTFAVAADAGPLTWSIVDPMLDSWTTYGYAIQNAHGWWCAEGPAIIKIFIDALPTAGASDFIRGENVVQAGSGFEGELISYTWDGVSSGYLVIAPRVRGTGTGRYGWDATNTQALTGAWSGASLPGANMSSDPREFREQVVFWKYCDSSNGIIFGGNFDVVSEASVMFSGLAGSATTCTTSIAPGSCSTALSTNNVSLPQSSLNIPSAPFCFPNSGNLSVTSTNGVQTVAYTSTTYNTFSGCTGGTGTIYKGNLVSPAAGDNPFPAHGIVVQGFSSPQQFCPWFNPNIMVSGQGLVIAIDNIEEQNHTADGTWTVAVPNLHTSAQFQGECEWGSFHRLNDVEEGDIHPFAYVWPTSWYNGQHQVVSRIAPADQTAAACSSCQGGQIWTTSGYQPFKIWRARSLASERFDTPELAYLQTNTANGLNSGARPSCAYMLYPETVLCAAQPKKVREPLWIVGLDGTTKYRKGTLRWAYWTQGGQRFHTAQSKTWIQFGNGVQYFNGTYTQGWATIIHGGWDGTTVQTAM